MPQLTDRRTPLALPTEPGAAGAPPPYLMVLVPVLAASLAYTWLLLDRGWVPHDEGMLAESAVRVLRGELPHRDFDEIYTGGLSYLHALAFGLLGERLISLRYVSYLAFAAWVPLVFYLASRFVGPLGAAGVTLASVVWSYPNYPAAMPSWYNLFLATASLVALFRYLDTGRHRWLVLAGLCAGLSVLVKVVGLYLVGATLLFFVFMEQSRAQAAARHPGSPRWYGALVVLGSTAVVVVLVLLVRARLGLPELMQFVLPGTLIAGLVTAIEVRHPGAEPRDRLAWLLRLALPYAAGLAAPVVVFGLFYAGHHALGDLLDGVFVRPSLRLSLAGRRPPPVAAILPSLLVAGAVVLCDRAAPRLRWVIAAMLALALAPLLRTEEVAGVGMLGWLSISQAIPLTVAAGVVGALGGLSGAEPRTLESRSLLLLSAALAFCNLVQYPWTNPTYFSFVAPLEFLALAAIASLYRQRLQPVATVLLAFYLLYAMTWLTPLVYRNYNNSADLLTGAPLTRLLPGRADLMVYDSSAVEYDSLVSLVRAEGRGKFIFATPDAPEVYFLTGFRNPTRTIFDFLDRPEGRTARMLEMLERRDVNLVVVNSRPGISAPVASDLSAALRDHYPNEAAVGRFTVRWR